MIKIYNTRTKKKEEFKPVKEGHVSMYVCGPTVYDLGHLGHGRSAVAFDVIRKYFEYRNFKVKFVSNYTDIDDKMINRAKEEKVSVPELAARIIPEYEKDYDALGIKRPDVQPRATETIPEIIEIIKKLEQREFIYKIDGDGMYFDISKFPKYGELSGQKLDDLKMGARVDVNENKKNPYDFVLWKFKKEGEPAWKSPWGEGRPGWHIECSAMTWKHLGEKFDIHGGGLDLTFPHHECEVAQSKAAFGKDAFAQYWMHNGFINVDNEKMSKSLGNFSTLRDIFKKYDSQVVRFMFLQTHYRNPINFSDKLLEQAKSGLQRIHDFIRNLGSIEKTAKGKETLDLDKYIKDFESCMDDDFDTSGALGALFNIINHVNSAAISGKLEKSEIKKVLEILKKFDAVLGIISPTKESSINSDIESLIAQREEARKAKDFKKSDEIRADLLKKGIVLEDTPHGTIWKKL